MNYKGYIAVDFDCVISTYCYSKDTEILTDQGWKYFKKLNKTEKVATLNPKTEEIIYQNPIAYQKYFYKGKMIKIKGLNTNLLVTPNHLLYIKKTDNSPYKLCKAKNIKTKFIKFKRDGKWITNKLNFFELQKVKSKTHKACNRITPANIWLEFLGYFLSEGHCYSFKKHYRTFISQSKIKNPKKWLKIKQNLGDLSKYLKSKVTINRNDTFEISNKSLYNYLKQFGKSRDKFIPRHLLNSINKTQCKILLKALLLGDGNKKQDTYFTISKQLADDVQELAFKAGFSATVSYKKNRYFVYIQRIKKCSKMQNLKRINYKDYIYDVTIPKYHILFVRRNGKCCWSSNSRPFRFNKLGKPVTEIIKVMKYYYDKNYHINIFTGRQYTPEIKEWLDNNKVPYHTFNEDPIKNLYKSKAKPFFSCIIDDKAVNYHYKHNKKSSKKLIKEINKIINWSKETK